MYLKWKYIRSSCNQSCKYSWSRFKLGVFVKNKLFPRVLRNRLLFILFLRSTIIPNQVSISICTCTNIFFQTRFLTTILLSISKSCSTIWTSTEYFSHPTFWLLTLWFWWEKSGTKANTAIWRDCHWMLAWNTSMKLTKTKILSMTL